MSNLVPQGIYCVGIPAPFLAHGMTELSHSELRVMLYIYLHTLGYQKSEDSLTYNQIIGGITTREGKQLDKGAGVSRRSLVEALQGLEKKGYIQRQAAPGANSASGKIAIRFNAPEFQTEKYNEELVPTKQTEVMETTTQNLVKHAPRPAKDPMQKLHLAKVQNLHPSCMNQHVLNHDDDKDFGTPEIKADCKTAVDYLLQNIPNLAENDASELAHIALVKNGRNLDYLKQLVGYILSKPKIHTPAAVLTKLIKNNSQRVSATSKSTYSDNSQKSRKAKPATQPVQSFPFASKFLAATKKPANPDFGNIAATSPEKTNATVKTTHTKNRVTKLTANFSQASFDWCMPTVHTASVSLSIEPTISGFSVKPSKISNEKNLVAAKLQATAPAKAKELPDLKATMNRLQEDIKGRLRFSVSSQLASLLEGASLELIRHEQEVQIIRLKFSLDFAERLISPQDYQVIKLSISQQLGCNYILQTGNISAKASTNSTFPADIPANYLYQTANR